MPDYLHGAYGQVNGAGMRVSNDGQYAIVYIGTAPVHTIEGGASKVNVPVVVHNIAEARKYFGYSEDYASYTLCEAMYVHLVNKGVGPLVFINVLDPATHKSEESGSVSKKPQNGRITIPEAESIILDSVTIEDAETAKKEKGKDYSITYNIDKRTITVTELSAGALGTEELTVKYDSVDPGKVEASDVIGSSDGLGLNTGLFAVRNVYQTTGFIPSLLLCPGFSSLPEVNRAMYENSIKINGHWNAYMYADLPITEKGQAVTMDKAKTFKDTNGYTCENEKVFFPLSQGIDGNVYHMSVLAAANFQELLMEEDGIPYKSSSNTDCPLIANLYLGEEQKGRVIDDKTVNELLNKNGIASAAFIGGRWAIWGAHSADYDQDNIDPVNVSETSRMMLYYISNDFQRRRATEIDKPLSPNDIRSIVSEEQARIDALPNIGALTYGIVYQQASADEKSDIVNGDHKFRFEVTTTPLAKSLTAEVNWTDEGLASYFEDESGAE